MHLDVNQLPLYLKMNKKATILVENVIFIILNLIFLGILILFIAKQASGAIVLEQNYAKQIALLIDSARPGTIMELNMNQAYEVSKKNKYPFDKIIHIDNKNNLVKIKLTSDSEYIYSFFNDVFVTYYSNKPGYYIFTINKDEK